MTEFTYSAFYIPRERMFGELAAMRSLGTKIVRLQWTGLSMWSAIEPEPGVFGFDLLDRVMEAAFDTGIQVVLPISIAPPDWAQTIYMADRSAGRPSSSFSQRVKVFRCYYDHRTRAMAERFVRLTVRRYKEHPAMYGWNACGGYEPLDETDYVNAHLVSAFKSWLKAEYGSLARVKEEWGDIQLNHHDSDFMPTSPVCWNSKAIRDWESFAAQYTDKIVKWLWGVVGAEDSDHARNALKPHTKANRIR